MPLDPGRWYRGDFFNKLQCPVTTTRFNTEVLTITSLKGSFPSFLHNEEKPLKAEIRLGCQSHILPHSNARLQPTFQLEGA